MEQLKEVLVVYHVNKGRGVRSAERGVAAIDDALEVLRGDLGRGDVQGEDLVGQLGEAEIFPALPRGGDGDRLGDVQAAVGGEALEDDLFEGELQGRVSGWCIQGLEARERTSSSSPRVLK